MNVDAAKMRKVLLVVNPTRPEAQRFAQELITALVQSGMECKTNFPVGLPGAPNVEDDREFEIALVLGGDGTMLRAAQLVLGTQIPVLGINLGNVGFLAEIEKPSASVLAKEIFHRNYRGEARLVLKFDLVRSGKAVDSGWALNELAIQRESTQMVELFVQIDDRPLSRWGCDGVICATPTGSTAYAFSAGGPVLWPEVEAMVVLPLAAHALFSKPLVIAPSSTVIIDLESESALVQADGMRSHQLFAGDRLVIQKAEDKITILHVESATFTDRLVAKFKLPIEGWRGE